MTEWRSVALTDLGSVERGRSRHRPRNDPSLYGDHMPFFQTGDVRAATLHMTSPKQFYSKEGVAQSRVWAPGITCITIAANIADTAVLGVPGCFPDSVLGFTPSHQPSDAYFVKYLLDHRRQELTSVARGTTQANLSLEKLLAQKFDIPSPATRGSIVACLRSLDDLVENNNRRAEVLRGLADVLYQEWFVRFEYPGSQHGASDSASLPDGWRFSTIADAGIVRLAKPKVASYAGLRTYLATADCSGLHEIGEGEQVAFDDLPSRAQHQPIEDTVWFARMAGYEKILIFPTGSREIEQYVLSSGFACLEPDTHWLSYLACWVMQPEFEQAKSQQATGATQVSLTDKGARRVPLLVPRADVVERFDEETRPLLETIVSLRAASRRLVDLREVLLPRLVTGQIDVADLDLDAVVEKAGV